MLRLIGDGNRNASYCNYDAVATAMVMVMAIATSVVMAMAVAMAMVDGNSAKLGDDYCNDGHGDCEYDRDEYGDGNGNG